MQHGQQTACGYAATSVRRQCVVAAQIWATDHASKWVSQLTVVLRMSEFQGEPHFDEDAQEAAEAIYHASGELTRVNAYVLSESEMEKFKKAQMALRELNESFDEYRSTD